MPKGLSALASAAALMCCVAAAAPPPAAADSPNIMIMGEDADRDTVPCNSRVFEAVRRAVVSQLDQQGYNVFDETAAMGPNFTAGRCRRADAELIDVLRAATRPPIDVAVLLRMYATVEELTYTARVRARISGRLLNVGTGQNLGGFEVRSPEEWTMRVDCAQERACLHNAYTLIFDGYSTDDVRLAEEYLVAFKDYQKHRTSSISPRRREYWYKSCIDSARLTRNFAVMFKFMNTPSTIDFSPSRNTFTLTKIPMRKRR